MMDRKKRLASIIYSTVLTAFLFVATVFSSSKVVSSPRIKEENSTTTTLIGLTNPEEAPFFTNDEGYKVGLIPELTSLINSNLSQAGANIQIKMMDGVSSYDDYKSHLEKGDFDLLLDATDLTPQTYISGFDLTNTYLKASYSKLSLKKTSVSVTNVAALSSLALGGQYAHSFYYSEQIDEFSTIDQCLTAVKNQQCSAAVINSFSAQKIINSDVRNTYVSVKLSENPLEIKIGVKQQASKEYLTKLNSAINLISEDTYNALVSRYSHFIVPSLSFADQIYLNPMAFILTLLGVFLVLIAFGIITINFRNRKTIDRTKKEFERFIAYVCQTNEVVYEINMANNTKSQYRLVKGKVTNISSAYSKQTDILEMIAPEDRKGVEECFDDTALKNLIQTSGQTSFEARIYNEKSQIIWTYCILQGIAPTKNKPASFMLFLHTIDEQKRKEAQAKLLLENALSQAEDANRSKSDFLARMSHEIRTPLNAVIGLSSIAKHYENDQAKVDECLDKIESSSKVLLGLINDILDMSAIENNKLKISYEEFSLRKIINDLYNIYQPQCQEKGIQLIIDGTIPDETLIGDSLRVSQILLNLLSNSYKFTPKGGRIGILLKRTSKDQNRVYYRLEISDNGVGMSEEMQARLFRPFEQENSDTAQKYGGSGLGLSIVKSLVTMMDGTIAVSSKLNEGSSFSINLPFGYPKDSKENLSEVDLKNKAALKHYDFHGAKILLAEDNQINMEIAVELLKMVNLSPDCAEDGEKVVELYLKAKDNYYKAILLDVQMPIMNGYQACRTIRKADKPDAKNIPIFAMTANAFSEDVTKALAAGMDGHIPKPIDSALLYKELDEAINRKKA